MVVANTCGRYAYAYAAQDLLRRLCEGLLGRSRHSRPGVLPAAPALRSRASRALLASTSRLSSPSSFSRSSWMRCSTSVTQVAATRTRHESSHRSSAAEHIVNTFGRSSRRAVAHTVQAAGPCRRRRECINCRCRLDVYTPNTPCPRLSGCQQAASARLAAPSCCAPLCHSACSTGPSGRPRSLTAAREAPSRAPAAALA